ncbi:MAG: hypothetical protein HY900_36775 [Deltaproteobacteria bacterium]|nr:hypothetical protein [Deltaproteobacteria bacterium]
MRELENYVRRMVVLGDVEGVRQEIRSNTPRPYGGSPEAHSFVDYSEFEGKTLKEVSRLAAARAERVVLEQVLQKTRWNRRKAAQMLDISYKALLYKIRDTEVE